MIKINLLPWREQRRQANKVRFGIIAAIFAGLAISCVITLHLYYNHVLGQQNKRKVYLESILNTEQTKLGALNEKQRELKVVVSNLDFILGLKVKSYQVVKALDQLVRVVPEGVIFNKLTREGNTLILVGMAKSDLQVTTLMESIDKSQVFKQPELTEISGKETGAGIRHFTLKLELENENTGNLQNSGSELLASGIRIKWRISV